VSDSELADLVALCSTNGRVCPMPEEWQQLWEMLPAKERIGGGWKPPLPLILAAWWDTTPLDKRRRLQQHLAYAKENGVLPQVATFLKSLPEDRWFVE
jgi:hypothetical protein